MGYPAGLYKLQAILVASFLLASASSAMISARILDDAANFDLMTRLKVDQPGGQLSSCWDALFQLQSCGGEVVLFFMNGQTHLSTGCCNAIRTIEHDCWPSILGTFGITPEENGILQGYCDAAAAPSPAAAAAAIQF